MKITTAARARVLAVALAMTMRLREQQQLLLLLLMLILLSWAELRRTPQLKMKTAVLATTDQVAPHEARLTAENCPPILHGRASPLG